jgi:hypothetical protein
MGWQRNGWRRAAGSALRKLEATPPEERKRLIVCRRYAWKEKKGDI